LGFGDEGKGSIVDYICRSQKAEIVVRYNGGAQAAHNVVTDDGRHHTFSQFGSGTFAGAKTHLSSHMLVNPTAIFGEANHLSYLGIHDPYSRLTIERDALVTTPFHVAMNRLREMARVDERHGSCGMGIGETTDHALKHPNDAIKIGFFDDPSYLRMKLEFIQDYFREEAKTLMDNMRGVRPDGWYREWDLIISNDTIEHVMDYYYSEFRKRVRFVDADYIGKQMEAHTTVFEGAQGVLLDQDWGFHPYTTWTNCTFGNADQILERSGHTDVKRIGVLRGFATRHGAGPFVTEDANLSYKEAHNGEGPWQRTFRLGHFDTVMTHYALKVMGNVDEIALTHLDQLSGPVKFCRSYNIDSFEARVLVDPLPTQPTLAWQEGLGQMLMNDVVPNYSTVPDIDAFLSYVRVATGKPIGVCSFGPAAKDKRVK
jgi:adenylosuccinate synthase